jgi:hypothetical protein
MTRNLHYRRAGSKLFAFLWNLLISKSRVSLISLFRNPHLEFLRKGKTIHVKSVSCVQKALMLHDRRGECHSGVYVTLWRLRCCDICQWMRTTRCAIFMRVRAFVTAYALRQLSINGYSPVESIRRENWHQHEISEAREFRYNVLKQLTENTVVCIAAAM